MISRPSEPTPEQFGVTAADVERAPAAFIRTHRAHLTFVVWLLVLSTAFVVLLVATGDLASAAFFAVIGTAAASILLLPLALCLLSAGEHAEVALRRRRVPSYAACAAYHEALTAYRETATRDRPTRSERWFACARRGPTRSEVSRALTDRGLDVVEVEDPEVEGFDLMVREEGRTTLVRCLPGNRQADPAVGREMAAVVADRNVQQGIIVAAAGATSELQSYLEHRSITVVDPRAFCSGDAPG